MFVCAEWSYMVCLCCLRVKEHLGQTIQAGGGTVGHSSVEDSVATLDLVRWHVLHRPPPLAKPTTSAVATNKL